MIVKKLLLGAAICLALALFGCGGGASAYTPPCCKPSPGPDEIGHFPYVSGSTVIAGDKTMLIRDESSWQTFWTEHNGGSSPASPSPPIDFKTTMLAGVIAAVPNDCYFVYARRILWSPGANSPDHIEITYHVQPPGNGCVVTQSPVNRFFLDAMPQSDSPVVFVPVD